MDQRTRRTGWSGRRFRIAAMLLALGACSGEDGPNDQTRPMAVQPDAAMDTTPAGTPAPPSPETIRDDQERVVEVRLLEWAVETSRDTVPAGEISFQVMNTGALTHALEVEGSGIEEATPRIDPGGIATLTLRLEPGTYELYCPVVDEQDHEARGMRTQLVVRSDAPTLMAPPSSD